jgi:peroxiredoxin/uncharacterized membrane protein YphA (DoxX/SURF4 family)
MTTMTVLVALVRLTLAIVFIVSAVAKLRDRPGSRQGVEAFGLPARLVGPVAMALPPVELLCALLLVLPDPAATVGAVGSLVLLTAFTAAIVVNLVQGRHPECHCFGSLGDRSGVGWDTVARNGALIVLAALALLGAGGLHSVPTVLATLSLADGTLLLAIVLLVAAVVVLSLALRTLMQRYGGVLLRLEALEQVTGLAAPKPAPDFRLPDLDGEQLALDEVLDQGRPVLIAFVSPSCTHCGELLPDLSVWQSDPASPLSVVVVSSGSVSDNRDKIADAGPLRVLLQGKDDLSASYEVQGTPAAVVVGVDGLLTGPPVHGPESVRGLHVSTLRTMGHLDPDPGPSVHAIEPRPVSAGDVAPDISVTSGDGVELSLADALGDDAVVLFWRVDCGFCQQILDDVRALEHSVDLRIVGTSDEASIRATGLRSPVLHESTGVLERWLGVPGTPSAARITAGALASQVAVGGPDVLAVVRAGARTDASAS